MALELERQQQAAPAPAPAALAPSSPALPPTPPSHDARSPSSPTHDGRSPPPPSPRSPLESKLPLSPPPSAASPRTLPFSIENILRPNFGVTTRLPERPSVRTPELLLRTPPKTPEAPVDLSQKPTTTTGTTAAAKVGGNKYPENPEVLANPRVPAEDGNNWPAWVYCTRYSDRPSSGESRCVWRVATCWVLLRCWCVVVVGIHCCGEVGRYVALWYKVYEVVWRVCVSVLFPCS